MIKINIKEIIAAFLPEICALCRQPVENSRECPFCLDCFMKWEAAKREASNAAFGGVPTLKFSDGDPESCGQALYLAFYDPKAGDSAPDALAFKLKQGATRTLLEFVANEYAGLLQRAAPELFNGTIDRSDVIVTWIPRRPESIREYGYDHMKCAAKALCRLTGFRCEQLIRRRKGSDEQKLLSADARLENVGKSLIASDADIGNKTVILIDDLVTTGASMKVGERILMESGARAVICAALLATRHKGM